MADELAPWCVAPGRPALDPLPKGVQAWKPLGNLVAGDDRGVDAADRGADDPVRLDAGFVQGLINPALIGAERAAALKDQHHLARKFGRLHDRSFAG